MQEKLTLREREADSAEGGTRLYEPVAYQHSKEVRERTHNGRVVVKDKDRPWNLHRQAKSKHYLSHLEPDLQDTVSQEWEVFKQIIPERSGKHIHQGGLVIFVLAGEGYTVVEGKRYDWKAGDAILLPLKPGGVEHQHFNLNGPDKPAQWVAFIFAPFFEYLGAEITQMDSCPLYEKERSLYE